MNYKFPSDVGTTGPIELIENHNLSNELAFKLTDFAGDIDDLKIEIDGTEVSVSTTNATFKPHTSDFSYLDAHLHQLNLSFLMKIMMFRSGLSDVQVNGFVSMM